MINLIEHLFSLLREKELSEKEKFFAILNQYNDSIEWLKKQPNIHSSEIKEAEINRAKTKIMDQKVYL